MTESMPSEKGRAARIALAVLAGALGTVLVGAGLWAAFRPRPEPQRQTRIEPAEPSQAASPGAGASGEATPTTATPIPGPGTGKTPSETASNGGRAVRAPLVAFRLGASLWVANEDGTAARRMLRSPDGPYALSPDGKTLAAVDGAQLKLVDVATAREASVGEAEEGMTPSWSADSAKVVYRRHKKGSTDSHEVWRVSRSGLEPAKVADGEQAAYAPLGDVLVVLNGDADGSKAFVTTSVNGGPFLPVSVTGGTPTAVGSNGSRIFVGVRSGERGSGIISLDLTGRDPRSIAGAVPGEMPASWSLMAVSPDGRLVAVQATGDDGYSRCFVMPAVGGDVVSVSKRRDGALHGWSAKGERLYLIEGNAFQGESTSLVSLKRDGSARRDVVTGAE